MVMNIHEPQRVTIRTAWRGQPVTIHPRGDESFSAVLSAFGTGMVRWYAGVDGDGAWGESHRTQVEVYTRG
jgi:hypothetical protein